MVQVIVLLQFGTRNGVLQALQVLEFRRAENRDSSMNLERISGLIYLHISHNAVTFIMTISSQMGLSYTCA